MVKVFNQASGDTFSAYNVDTVEFTAAMPSNSIDLSVYSPPFSSLYIYSESARDMGNVDGDEEFNETYRHLIRELFRVTRPGRMTAIHVKDLVYYSNASDKGDRGLRDFTGDCIRAHLEEGWTLHSRVTVWRCPVREMQKSKPDGLLFKNFRTDACRVRVGLPEYIVVFRKWAPGMEETMPVKHPVELWRDWRGVGMPEGWTAESIERDMLLTGEDAEFNAALNLWQQWASPVWMDTRETDVLNAKVARDKEAEKHLCLARDSQVLTGTGYKPIQEVDIGEMVLTHKGRWRPVIAKKNTGVRQVVTIKAQGVPGLTLTPDHKIWSRVVPQDGKWDACFAKKRAAQSYPDWTRADEMLGNYVNLKLPPVVDGDSLSDDDWWVVGRWLGDGHIGPRGALFISCGYHEADDLMTRLGDRAGMRWDNHTAVQIRIKDRDGHIRAMIAKCGRGAANKQFPVECFSLPKQKAKSVLDGYLSADGSFLEDRNRYNAMSVSKCLLFGAALLFQRVHGVSASIFPGRIGGNKFIEGRSVTTRQEWCLSAYLSTDDQRVKPFILDDGAWNKVKSIEDSGEQETWCLRVDEDESFTAEGCVVKNCPMPLDLTDRVLRLYSNRGEVVYSPFMGIGSEGWASLRAGRKFIGTELKDSYYAQAAKNLREMEERMAGGTLLEWIEAAE